MKGGSSEPPFYIEVHMKRIVIDSTQTLKGVDPIAVYYARLHATYPALDLTRDNSTILLVQGMGTPDAPDDTIVRISQMDQPWKIHEFVHNRFDLGKIIPTPTFNTTDLTAIAGFNGSAKLVEYMATKFNRAFTPESIWTELASIPAAGGTTSPNWYMKAVWDSMFWYGEKLVRLHP